MATETPNETTAPLSTEEQVFIAAYRAGRLDVMESMMRKQAEALGKEVPPAEPRVTRAYRSLDVAERLAMFIVGALALRYPQITPLIDNGDKEAPYFLWEDVANAIKDSLPHLDMVEIRRLNEGVEA